MFGGQARRLRVNRHVWIAAVGLTSVMGVQCRRKHPRSFSQARKDLRAAVRKGDCKMLYRVLDEKTRWAAMSLVRDAKRVQALIKAHYPEADQPRELARVYEAATSKNAKQWFARYCTRTRLLAELKDLGGKPKAYKAHGKSGTLTSGSGRKVTFSRDAYGQWGCDVIRARVVALQVRMANLYKMAEENAKVYRKARARNR
jgi:hypothetical protein